MAKTGFADTLMWVDMEARDPLGDSLWVVGQEGAVAKNNPTFPHIKKGIR